MESTVRSAQVHPEFDNREDSEGSIRSGHLKAIGALVSVGERWDDGGKGGDMDTPPCPEMCCKGQIGITGKKVASQMVLKRETE